MNYETLKNDDKKLEYETSAYIIIYLLLFYNITHKRVLAIHVYNMLFFKICDGTYVYTCVYK